MLFLPLFLIPFASASLARVQQAAPVVRISPTITPSPVLWDPTRTYKHRRDIVDDFKAGVHSALTFLGSNVPSYVASGVPNFFQEFPIGEDVRSSLGIEPSQVAALPTQVLNIP